MPAGIVIIATVWPVASRPTLWGCVARQCANRTWKRISFDSPGGWLDRRRCACRRQGTGVVAERPYSARRTRLTTQTTTIMPATCQSSQMDSPIPGGFTGATILAGGRTHGGHSRGRTAQSPAYGRPRARQPYERSSPSRTGRSSRRRAHACGLCTVRPLERCPVLDPPSSPHTGSWFWRGRLAIIHSAGFRRHPVWAFSARLTHGSASKPCVRRGLRSRELRRDQPTPSLWIRASSHDSTPIV